jgi:DNA-binding LytR/AlgR family response regulator
MVVALKKMAGDKYLFKCIDSFEWKAAEYIIELEQQLRNEKEINAHLWKSLAQVEKQRDHISEELSKR